MSLKSSVKVSIDVLSTKIRTALVHEGHTAMDAEVMRDAILYAELRGNNQGVIKLVTGALKPTAVFQEMELVHELPVSAKLNGKQRPGMAVLSKSVGIAISKAKIAGIGVVGCSGYSSASGALGFWAEKIASENLIGVVMSQCNELVAPHGSYEPIFGTNPIAFGLPTSPKPLVFDMATSASAWFGLAMAKEEGKMIPNNVAFDCAGSPTTDPAEAMKGALRVFDRSFKGSNLALMVELLAGAWTGAAMNDKANSGNWGSLVIAMDPNILGPIEEFQSSAAIMCERVKNAKKLPGSDDSKLFLPGERGDQLAEKRKNEGSLELPESIYNSLNLMCS